MYEEEYDYDDNPYDPDVEDDTEYDSDTDWWYADDHGDYDDDMSDFADPSGRSALRAATPRNPRIYPCPTCGGQNLLTQKDIDLCYQCDSCADQAERGY